MAGFRDDGVVGTRSRLESAIYVADSTARLALDPSIDGQLVVEVDTNQVYSWDEGSSTWIPIGGSLSPSSVDDTNTIDHTITDGVLTSDLVYQDSNSVNLSDDGSGLKAEVIDSGVDHGSLGGLEGDDHSQYPLLAGRSGGQQLYGGSDSGDNLILESTSNGTKGNVEIQGGQLLVDYNGSGSAIAWANSTLSNMSGNFKLAINSKNGSNSQINLCEAGSNRWSILNDGNGEGDLFVISSASAGNAITIAYATSLATFVKGLNIAASTALSCDGTDILSDSSGTMTLKNIDALDATSVTTIEGAITHGNINGLDSDDHSQYHNDTRGDARYYQKSEFLNTSAGGGDAGKPVKLDAAGHIDATMINDGDVTHNSTAGKQGGTTDEYYHLTNTQHTIATQAAGSSVSGYVTTGAQNLAGNKTFDDDVVVTGDLTVNGTTVTLNTATLDVEDVNITVNNGGNQASADDAAGITVEMSDATDAVIIYDKDVTSKWKLGETGSAVEIADVSSSQTLTNKTIDADNNSISNIDNDEIKANAGIDASKIADGTVSNTEFQYINSLSHNNSWGYHPWKFW